MNNNYDFEKELDKNITYETHQILNILIHVFLIGSIITFSVGVLSYLI